MTKEIKLAPDVFNCQIIDKDGIRCGKVDDLLLEGEAGKTLKISAIIVGIDAWTGHNGGNVFAWIIKKLFHKSRTRTIPVSHIATLFPIVKLKNTAAEEQLATFERKLAHVLQRFPGA